MPTGREYIKALRRMPPDAPCEDRNGYKLATVAEVLAQIQGDRWRDNGPVKDLPRLRKDGVVVC